jgi:two-component system OmpR family response regulator
MVSRLSRAVVESSAKHILIVEDEQHLAQGIRFNLDAEGYRVTVVGDGPSALRLVRADPTAVDLIILDLMLPGMSGYAVCEQIRQAGNDVPILILSARTLTEDRIRGLDVGADQYLQKPFELDELLAMVRNLLTRRGRFKLPAAGKKVGDVLEFGRARVNFDTFEVTVDGKRLRLTPMELKLLRFFAEHEGSVLSRNQLLDAVWGLKSTVVTRTVDNFVMRLRKYFEADPARPRHFLSVRGAGYRFVAKAEEEEAAG